MEQLTRLALLYLDPATGSLTFQLLIGGLLAIAAAGRKYLRRIIPGWLRFSRGKGA